MPTTPFVAIVDCGVGNHTSVRNALSFIGVQSEVTDDPVKIGRATHLILPGVGSFAEGMAGIRAHKLEPILRDEVLGKRKNILGICLGMQLFASKGFEHGEHTGLGFLPGDVRIIKTGTSGVRLPHIGWNNVRVTGEHRITKNFAHDPVFYFVHSYHLLPEDRSIIAGVCDYGEEIAALLECGNIFGAQFHPEKSHDDGMQVLKNFTSLPC